MTHKRPHGFYNPYNFATRPSISRFPASGEGYLEGFSLHGADFLYGETQDVSLRIYFLHHPVVFRLAEVAFFAFEDDLEVVAFGIVPELYDVALHGAFLTVLEPLDDGTVSGDGAL